MITLYRFLLHLYPASFHRQFAAEMEAVFAEGYAEQTRAAFVVREFMSLITAALYQWLTRPAHPYAIGLLIAFSLQETLLVKIVQIHGRYPPVPLEAYASLLLALLLLCPHCSQLIEE